MNITKISEPSSSSPLADIGYFIDVDGCVVTAQAVDFVLEKLPVRDRWCVEFGAGADTHGSTTHRLITGQNYSAVLIEGVPEKFQFLQKTYKDNPRVKIFEKFVSFKPDDPDCLDLILAGTSIPADFDLLSIDIDGNDYHVWNAVRHYQPKIVMVEFNPTMAPDLDYVQPADPALCCGNSLAAFVRLAKSKAYELIAVVGVNAFFARRDLFGAYGIADNRIEALWTKRDCVTHIFSTYDGRIMLQGCQKLPWHFSIPIREAKMQVLPKFLQKYPLTRNDYRLFQLINSPLGVVKKILTRFGL